MIGVDFRTVGPTEHVQRVLARLILRARALRMGLLVGSVLFVFVSAETIRLAGALHGLHELELRRDVLALDVARMQARVRIVGDRRAALLTALARRRSNADLAVKIAAVSDLLGSSMALTQLRAVPAGFDLQGTGTSMTEIRTSLNRLESSFGKSATFELRRDDAVPSAIAFHFNIASK